MKKFLKKFLKKIPEFKKSSDWLYDNETILGELYKIRWMQKNISIELEAFFSVTFFNNDLLNVKESRYYKRNEFSFINWKEKLVNNLYKILRTNTYIQSEIGKYIYNDGRIWLRRIDFRFKDDFVNWLIEKINSTKIFKHSLRDWFDMLSRSSNNELDEWELEKEFLEIEKYINDKKIDILNKDFYIIFNIPIDHLLKFLILRFEEQNIQIDTKKIESLFENLSIESKKQANISLYISLWLISLIIIFNILLIIFNKNFNIIEITRYIPMLILEILFFKFMFFFFDKYNTYSKISSIYYYYVWLVQSDNIYTSDKKFTDEQNFILREKTYLELTNLSTHIKWIIDKKPNSWNNVIQILKEINNISPLLKNLNK